MKYWKWENTGCNARGSSETARRAATRVDTRAVPSFADALPSGASDRASPAPRFDTSRAVPNMSHDARSYAVARE
ncbi:hypothetical protein OAD67_02290 [bacterium]|nr:hypothetical protein [bacterium]